MLKLSAPTFTRSQNLSLLMWQECDVLSHLSTQISDKTAHDIMSQFNQGSLMPEINDYIKEVTARTIEARKAAGFKSQALIAEKMGITRDRYARYETERIIHKEYISKFCEITSINERWLLTGEGAMAAEPKSELISMGEKLQSGYNAAPEHIQKTINELLGIKDK